jgi:hypothetical protein
MLAALLIGVQIWHIFSQFTKIFIPLSQLVCTQGLEWLYVLAPLPTFFLSPSSTNISHCKRAEKEPSKIMVLQTKKKHLKG